MNENESFETSLRRIETILEKLNSSTVSLEDSIVLFEEANKLIKNCSQTLEKAEQKVELMIKERNGELQVDDQGSPISETLATQKEGMVTRTL